jgi:hypothetical protein
MGIVTAHKLMKEYQEVDKVIESLYLNQKYKVPPSYKKNFDLAYMAFKYQIVFDEEENQYIYLNEPDESDYYGKKFLEMENKDFAGKIVSKEHASKICLGEINPITLKPIDIESLLSDFKRINDPSYSLETASVSDSSSDVNCTPSLNQENKPHNPKKSSSTQKKILFARSK